MRDANFTGICGEQRWRNCQSSSKIDRSCAVEAGVLMADKLCGLMSPLLYFGYDGHGILLGMDGVFRVSIDGYDAAWTGHLKL